MRKVIKLSVVLFSILMATSVSAQDLSFGVKAGVNFSKMDLEYVYESGGMKIGPVVGVTMDYGITESLFLLTGLDLSFKGFKESEYEYSYTLNPIYLQVPIHAAYKVSIAEAENVKIVFDAGPYVAFGIAGKETFKDKEDGTSDSEDLFGDGIDQMKRFDFGMGLGIGLELEKLKFSIGYDHGLANISNDSEYKVYNRNFFLTVGYRF